MADVGGDPHALALLRVDEDAEAIDALASHTGGRVGLEGVLADLHRRARPARAPIPGAVRRLTWDAEDRRTRRWWPQGITTTADASPDGSVLGHRLLAVSWYARRAGSHQQPATRVSFLDLDTLHYRHVALVRAVRAPSGEVHAEPVRVHAGGIVWRGGWLHVAATRRGFLSFRIDEALPVRSDDPHDEGPGLALPLRTAYRPALPDAPALRHSFLSLDRSTTPAGLLAGEYARGDQPARLVRYPLDADTGLPVTEGPGSRLLPTWTAETGLARMQGAVTAHGQLVVTTSQGRWAPGSLVVGQPGAWHRHRRALPMGPEAIGWSPTEDLLWTLSEHPRRRWIVALPASGYVPLAAQRSRG